MTTNGIGGEGKTIYRSPTPPPFAGRMAGRGISTFQATTPDRPLSFPVQPKPSPCDRVFVKKPNIDSSAGSLTSLSNNILHHMRFTPSNNQEEKEEVYPRGFLQVETVNGQAMVSDQTERSTTTSTKKRKHDGTEDSEESEESQESECSWKTDDVESASEDDREMECEGTLSDSE